MFISLKKVLSLEKAFSSGIKLGLYRGRKYTRASELAMMYWTQSKWWIVLMSNCLWHWKAAGWREVFYWQIMKHITINCSFMNIHASVPRMLLTPISDTLFLLLEWYLSNHNHNGVYCCSDQNQSRPAKKNMLGFKKAISERKSASLHFSSLCWSATFLSFCLVNPRLWITYYGWWVFFKASCFK